MADTEIGKMTVYKDDEGDSVLKVYGKIQTDKKLDTEAQTIVEAINELKKLSGEGGGEADWTMPAHWLDIPDPAPGEIILYAEIDEKSINCPISSIGLFSSETHTYPGGTIDWGDGWVDTISEGYAHYCSHAYTKAGQYIIKATPNDGISAYLPYTGATYIYGYETSISNVKQDNILAFKIGANIILDLASPFERFTNLIYAEFCGQNIYKSDNYSGVCFRNNRLQCIKLAKSTLLAQQYFCQNTYSLKKITGLPEIIPDMAFYYCHGLRELDLTGVKTLGAFAFDMCYGLKKVYAPDLTSICQITGKLDKAFVSCYNLEEFYAPKLAEISGDEFYQCYSLKKLTLADGCNLNGNTFNYCPLLYPKPKN